MPIFTTNATVKARTTGVGVLTKQDALMFGTVGPTARALVWTWIYAATIHTLHMVSWRLSVLLKLPEM